MSVTFDKYFTSVELVTITKQRDLLVYEQSKRIRKEFLSYSFYPKDITIVSCMPKKKMSSYFSAAVALPNKWRTGIW